MAQHHRIPDCLLCFWSESFRGLLVVWSSDNSLSAPGTLARELARGWQGIVAGTADGKAFERP